uniref:Toxoplasma gondii family A protein n=1 Tax=Toxoplasma gondii COUG TaxID=1074873 RepID=A0A2G8YC56_TOXGO|nr:hypothetical protein TGCOUG_245600 [Toxoplasma gondii COUG]
MRLLLATLTLLAALLPAAVFAAPAIASPASQSHGVEAEKVDISSEEAEGIEAFSEEASEESPTAAADSLKPKDEETLKSSAATRQAGRKRRVYSRLVTSPSYDMTATSYSKLNSYSVPWYTPTTYSQYDYETSYYYPSTKTHYTSDTYAAPLSTKTESIPDFSYRTTYRPATAYYSRPITTYYTRSTDYAPYAKDAGEYSTRQYYYRPRTTLYRPMTTYYAPATTETTYSKDSDFESYSLDYAPSKSYSRTTYRPAAFSTYEYAPSKSYSLADSKGSDIEEYDATHSSKPYYSRSGFYSQRAIPAAYRTAYGRPTTTYTYPVVTRTTRFLQNRQNPLKKIPGGTNARTAAETTAHAPSSSPEDGAYEQLEASDKHSAGTTSSRGESKESAGRPAAEPALPETEKLGKKLGAEREESNPIGEEASESQR